MWREMADVWATSHVTRNCERECWRSVVLEISDRTEHEVYGPISMNEPLRGGYWEPAQDALA